MSWNGISLSRRFDSEEASAELARELGMKPEFDAAWALGSAFYDVLTSDSPQLYDEQELGGAAPLKKLFDELLKPLAESLRLVLDDEGKKMVTRALIKELRRQLRNAPENRAFRACRRCRGAARGAAVSRAMSGQREPSAPAVTGTARAVAKIRRRARYIPFVKRLVETFKGKGSEVEDIVFSDDVDEYRLELARRVVMMATAVYAAMREAIEASKRIGPGYLPARAGVLSEPSELARALPEAQALLATRHGRKLLAAEELSAMKTYAVDSVDVSRQRVDRLGLVIDCSGSMAGDEILIAAAIGIARVWLYRPKRVDLLFFNTRNRIIKAASAADTIRALAAIEPGGGTDIAGAVEAALREFRDAQVIDVVTDGRDYPRNAPRDPRLRYVIVSRDGWENWGWKSRSDATLVEVSKGRIRVVYPGAPEVKKVMEPETA